MSKDYSNRKGYEIWKTIFTFDITSLEPLFPIDDFPYGHGKWHLEAKFLKSYKGSVNSSPDETFSTNLEIYVGPIRARPAGFWVFTSSSEIPKKGEIWTALCRDSTTGLRVQDILRDSASGCLGEKGDFGADTSKNQ